MQTQDDNDNDDATPLTSSDIDEGATSRSAMEGARSEEILYTSLLETALPVCSKVGLVY